VADAGELKARATLDNAEFLSSLKDLTNQVGAQSKATADQIGAISDAFGAVGSAMAGIGAIGALGKFYDEALNAANATDKLAAGFKAINGPSEETAAIFEEISGLEMKSQFDFEDTLGPAAKHMMMLGVSAEQTAATMTALVDAAAGMKEGPQWIEAVSGSIATMQTHIVASGKDMKALQALGIGAWDALAREMDTSISGAMKAVKDGLVSAETVTKAVTEEMGERFKGAAERSMGTWAGAMHGLIETTEDAMVAIRHSIKEILNDAAPIIKAATDAIAAFAQWWEDLPGPMQEALLIVPAVLAAIVGVSGAFAALQLALGALTFNPVVLGIGALVAALALIGKWAYDNWPAIKAVFAETVDFLAGVFSPLITLWKAEWAAIQSVLSTVWEWVSGAINGLKATVSDFLGWLGGMFAKLPGASELAKLGEIWKTEQAKMADAKTAIDAKKKAADEAASSATKLRQEAQKAEAQELAAANASKKAAEQRKKAADEQEKWAKEREQWEKKLVASNDAMEKSDESVAETFRKASLSIGAQAIQTADIVVSNYERWGGPNSPLSKAIRLHGEADDAMKKLGLTSTQTMQQAVTDSETWAKTVGEAADAGQASWTDYNAALDIVQQKQKALKDYTEKDLTEAYHQFGLKSAGEMTTLAQKSDEAYNKIVADAGADSLAAKQAWVTKTEETYANILAQGGTLTQGQKSELDRQKQQIEDHLNPLPSMWKTAYDGVKSAVGESIDAMIDKLVTGEGSFKDIFTGLWQDIASAALHAFIDPVKEAIADFIATTVADLLSGKGFGGVLDSLKDIGSAAKDVFGGATGAAGSAGDIAGAGGGAARAGGGAASSVGSAVSSSLTGWIGAIGSAVTAISSVIGNFQMAKMETTLNAIEHSTRYSELYLGSRSDGGILGVLFRVYEELAYGALVKAAERTRDVLFDWTGVMTPLMERTASGVEASAAYLSNSLDLMRSLSFTAQRIEAASRDQGPRQITIQISPQGLTTAEAARALGNQIAANLGRQLAPVA
jgi:hypothetical protein